MPLKRTPLQRKTPLTARPQASTYERPPAPLMDLAAAAAALGNQAASAALPRREHAPVAPVSQRAPKPHDSGFPAATRQVILDRDTPPGEERPRCQRCGRVIIADSWHGYSIQHRDNRGAGGTSDPRVNWPSNGIVLCGSATTPGGCHLWAESHQDDAAREGFIVLSWADAETVPVRTYRGWLLLSPSGTAWLTAEPVNGDAHHPSVARRKVAFK